MRKTGRTHKHPNSCNSRQCIITCHRKVEIRCFLSPEGKKIISSSCISGKVSQKRALLSRAAKDELGRMKEGLSVLKRHAGRDTPGMYPDGKHRTQHMVKQGPQSIGLATPQQGTTGLTQQAARRALAHGS